MFGKKISMDKGRIALIQKKVGSMVDTLLENKVQIFIAPNSDEVFLVDKERSICLCLEHSTVKIANHDYLYSENLPLSFIENQKKKVKAVLEERYKNLKKELFKNEVGLLDKIGEIYA